MKIHDFRKIKDFENNLAEIHFYRNAYPDFHGHAYWELIIMIEGKSLHSVMDKNKNKYEYIMEKNDFCFLSPNFFHRFSNIENISSLHITLTVTEEFVENTLNLFDPILFNTLKNKEKFIEGKLRNEQILFFIDNANKMLIAREQNSKLKELIPKMAFLEFANILTDIIYMPKNDYPDWFNDLLNKINNVENISLSIEEICKMSGYSHSQLLRIFKKYLNMTINEYITENKLSYCCSLLENTNFTTLDICNKLNFSSLSHLNKIFKKRYNVTPSEYRKRLSIKC